MENQVGWHGKAPNEEQYIQAMKELETQGTGLKCLIYYVELC